MLRALFVASETAPYSKTGGLGDVAGALPSALYRLGVRVISVSPLHRCVAKTGGVRLVREGSFQLHTRKKSFEVTVYTDRNRAGSDLPPSMFLDIDGLFDREGIYRSEKGEYSDNISRFGLFSKAAVEVCSRLAAPPHVLHANDWQTALCAYYAERKKQVSGFMKGVTTVLTVHNLAYQGYLTVSDMDMLGINPGASPLAFSADHGVSLLGIGLEHADTITTVSPSYKHEVTRPGHGAGLDHILSAKKDLILGILNGADYESWNPLTDQSLPAAYSIEDMSGKAACKRELLARFKLPGDMGRPLFVMPARLTMQKGWDIVSAACREIVEMGACVAFMGEGEPHYEHLVRKVAHSCRPYTSFYRGYNEDLAHLMHAGGDCLLMPSFFEPCGLSQLYAMRYGTIPVVRAVGGLKDTVKDPLEAGSEATGFKFMDFDPKALVHTVSRCLSYFRRKDAWDELVSNAMRQDFSWNQAARAYISAYYANSPSR